MPLTLKSNANFDSAAAAVAAPYGPLTRVGTMPDLDVNSNQAIEVTSAKSVSLLISYDDMVDEDKVNKILIEAHSTNGLADAAYRFHLLLNVMKAHADVMDNSGWYTNTEFAQLIKMIRYFQPIFALLPISAYLEYDGSPIVVDFDVEATGLVATVTNTTEGEADFYTWDFGDGTVSTEEGFEGDEIDHTYSGAGTKTITLTAVGPGGIKIKTKTQAVA